MNIRGIVLDSLELMLLHTEHELNLGTNCSYETAREHGHCSNFLGYLSWNFQAFENKTTYFLLEISKSYTNFYENTIVKFTAVS